MSNPGLTIHGFHQTGVGYLLFGIVELAVAYGFASLSIDRGNLWYYLLTLVFSIGALQNFLQLIKKLFGGQKHG